MAIKMAQKIIIKGVSSQITLNIINTNNSKNKYDMLKRIFSEVGQEIVYLVLQEILNYPRIHKLKRYIKPEVEIFAEIRLLCKRLKTRMIVGHDGFDTIAIVIILNTLYSDFEATIASILKTGNKIIKEI